ncbi:MAG: N-6 DNA methylase [Spirochaetaceae bacterium]|nr:N-6 DNA methylase [Spirochaetaceae bacterium]
MRELTYREAADQLNVSPATVKNWTRQGLLSTGEKLYPLKSDILQFKRKLGGKKSRRLTSRANKSSARRRFIPLEYVEQVISRKMVNNLAEKLQLQKEDSALLLFALSLHLIAMAGLINKKSTGKRELPHIDHKNLSIEINEWYRELKSPPIGKLMDYISELPIPLQRDTPGLIYQLLQNEGRKSEKGSYYTPPSYADEVLNMYGYKGQRFLDPCCGTGMFLLAAAKKYQSPLNIYGWDNDKTAVRLARINLMLFFREMDFKPQIFLKNSLIDDSDEKFDLIATNPPWGQHFSREDKKNIQKRFRSVKTGESFSYFIEKGISLLSEKGVLSYLLPEALLKVKTHKDIREFLLEKVHIKYVKFLGQPFNKVQTRVIRMDMKKNRAGGESTVFLNNHLYSVDSRCFWANPYNLFDFNCNKTDNSIINTVYEKKHDTLKNQSLWILGIVSGNNKRFISREKKPGYRPFICGQDLRSMQIKKPERYILFDRKILQQSAPAESYDLSPKIVYKFITGAPVFAIDREGFLTLNSANSFYSHLETPVEIIVALFNSDLYRFIYRKKFNSIKILRNHLEQLPVPRFSTDEIRQLTILVQKIEKSGIREYSTLMTELNDFIFRYFEIGDRDRSYILEKSE